LPAISSALVGASGAAIRLAREEYATAFQAYRVIVLRGQASLLQGQNHGKIIDPEQFLDQEKKVKRPRQFLAVMRI
jgi:hypothetical protein